MERYERIIKRYFKGKHIENENVVYAIGPEFRIIYFNDTWNRFAEENNGQPAISRKWSYGSNIMDAVPDSIKSFYRENYLMALRTGNMWQHDYECSSDALYRLFHQTVYPVKDPESLLIVNALRIESPIGEYHSQSGIPDDRHYRNRYGFITQCAHCRRIENPAAGGRWDWISDWVRKLPEKVSHSLCPTCFNHFYQPEFVK